MNKQKMKENRIARNAHNMKNPDGDRLNKREDRLSEIARRKRESFDEACEMVKKVKTPK